MSWDPGNPPPGKSLVAYTPFGIKVHKPGLSGRTQCNRPADLLAYAVIVDSAKCQYCFPVEGASDDCGT